VAKHSIYILASIALNLKESVPLVVRQINLFVSMERDYLTNQAIIVYKDILRKYPKETSSLKEIVK